MFAKLKRLRTLNAQKAYGSLVLIEMPKKRTAALFDQICQESVKLLCVIRVREDTYSFFQSSILNVHAKKAYIYTYLIEYAC